MWFLFIRTHLGIDEMEVLYPKYPGRIVICSSCGALLGNIKEQDIYGSNVYCPLCKQPTAIDYDKNYDGIIKEQKSDGQQPTN